MLLMITPSQGKMLIGALALAQLDPEIFAGGYSARITTEEPGWTGRAQELWRQLHNRRTEVVMLAISDVKGGDDPRQSIEISGTEGALLEKALYIAAQGPAMAARAHAASMTEPLRQAAVALCNKIGDQIIPAPAPVVVAEADAEESAALAP